jgi:hypothetical protein
MGSFLEVGAGNSQKRFILEKHKLILGQKIIQNMRWSGKAKAGRGEGTMSLRAAESAQPGDGW